MIEVLAHARPSAAGDRPTVEVLEIDAFGERGKCIAAHREAIDWLRSITGGSRNR